jgi:hypothetical protein
MTKKFRELARIVDIAVMKGFKDPIKIYTIDLETAFLSKAKDKMDYLTAEERKNTINELRKDIFN